MGTLFFILGIVLLLGVIGILGGAISLVLGLVGGAIGLVFGIIGAVIGVIFKTAIFLITLPFRMLAWIF
jgi:hypothetical protein